MAVWASMMHVPFHGASPQHPVRATDRRRCCSRPVLLPLFSQGGAWAVGHPPPDMRSNCYQGRSEGGPLRFHETKANEAGCHQMMQSGHDSAPQKGLVCRLHVLVPDSLQAASPFATSAFGPSAGSAFAGSAAGGSPFASGSPFGATTILGPLGPPSATEVVPGAAPTPEQVWCEALAVPSVTFVLQYLPPSSTAPPHARVFRLSDPPCR